MSLVPTRSHSFPLFFDVHSHINDACFDEDRNEVLARMSGRGVWAIMVGTDQESSEDVTRMASLSPEGVFASIGVHPIDDRNKKFREQLFAELATSARVVAVGECGLDYSRLADVPDITAEKSRQRELFEMQADFALAQNLPLMIHCRDSDKKIADAHTDVLAILRAKKNMAGGRLRGNVHFFAQTIDIACEYFALDFTISFTGVITFSNEYDEVVRLAPLDKIMSETDCPYVAPVPYRGKRNEPIYVEEVVKKIAEIRGEDFEAVRAALVQNAVRIFNITPHI
ncbi:MAG: TatD family hydrolase [Candidatus Yonathbacteria bacterium]|nr:TatD family hydrolase [Candidatus Yonathbacteria bacterium]